MNIEDVTMIAERSVNGWVLRLIPKNNKESTVLLLDEASIGTKLRIKLSEPKPWVPGSTPSAQTEALPQKPT